MRDITSPFRPWSYKWSEFQALLIYDAHTGHRYSKTQVYFNFNILNFTFVFVCFLKLSAVPPRAFYIFVIPPPSVFVLFFCSFDEQFYSSKHKLMFLRLECSQNTHEIDLNELYFPATGTVFLLFDKDVYIFSWLNLPLT